METKLRELRKAKGYSAKDMAGILEMSLSTYNKWEMGTVNYSFDSAVRLCEVLGCSLDTLAGREQDSSPERQKLEYYLIGLNDEGRKKVAELSELVFMHSDYRA